MSDALAIAAVTNVLLHLMQDGLNANHDGLGSNGNNVTVTTQPPDKVQASGGPMVNLFLYQANLNPSWRNRDIPWQTRPGETKPEPLPLDLHYLITVYYGEAEDGVDSSTSDALLGSHRLLGRAMSILHDHPILSAEEINRALPAAERDRHPYDQMERVRITPQPLSLDELSKIWTGFQTQYRLSAAYEASVVLIESTRPARAPLPVLRRGPQDEGVETVLGPFPILEEIRRPAGARPGIQLGDLIEILGQNLPGEDTCLLFQHTRYRTLQAHLFDAGLQFADPLDAGQLPAALRQHFEDVEHALTPAARVTPKRPGNEWTISDGALRYEVRRENGALGIYIATQGNVVGVEPGSTTTRLQVQLPNPGNIRTGQAWPAGLYQVATVAQCAQAQPEKTSNQLPLLLAPALQPLSFLAAEDQLARDNQGNLTLPIQATTEVLLEQGASLLVGSHTLAVVPHPAETNRLVFEGRLPATNDFLVVRLRVDGVDSLAFKLGNGALTFDPAQKIRLLPSRIVKTESGAPVVTNGNQDIPVTVTVANEVQPGQQASLVVSGITLPAVAVPADRKVTFTLTVPQDLDSVVVRLLVDGVEEPRAKQTDDGFILNPGHKVDLR